MLQLPNSPLTLTFSLERCEKSGSCSLAKVANVCTLALLKLSREFVLCCIRYICETESGVMCVDFHPEHPNYIAVGFYDGKCPCSRRFAQFTYTLFFVINNLRKFRLVQGATHYAGGI